MQLAKYVLCIFCILGAIFILKETVSPALKVIGNFEAIIEGTYKAPEIQCKALYSFFGYALGSLVLFSLFSKHTN